jgi:hypothetical protein
LLAQNADNLQLYPLPESLNLLPERDKADYLSRTLPNKINDAAQALWESKYYPIIFLMLGYYHMRPKGQNDVQHPTPSATFAHSIMQDYQSTEEEKSLVGAIINTGTRRNSPGGPLVYLFEHETTTATPLLDINHLNLKLEKVVHTSNVDEEHTVSK